MTIGLIAKLGPRLAVVGAVLIVHRPRPEMPGRPQLLTSWLRLLIGTSPRLKQLILDPNTGLFFAGWSFWWNSTLQSFADPIMWSYVKRLVSSKNNQQLAAPTCAQQACWSWRQVLGSTDSWTVPDSFQVKGSSIPNMDISCKKTVWISDKN